MAKAKRGKSGSSTEMSRWELELSQAPLNEDFWKSMCIFVSPDNIADVDKIDCMTEVAATGLRKLISVIDYNRLLQQVKELGSHGKGGKGKVVAKPPQFIEICDQVKSILDQGDQLSPLTLAKLIKFKMLSLKQGDLERRLEEKKAADAAAKQGKQGEDRSRSRLASGKRTKSQSPSKKKGKKDDRPPSPKKDTKLKRRGEVEDTFKTIDDEPDGPNDPHHYFLITGFYDPKLFISLTEIGVFPNVNFILKSESEENIQKTQSPEQEDPDEEQVNMEDEERQKMETETKIRNLKNQTDLIINNLTSGHPLKNMADVDVILQGELGSTFDVCGLENDARVGFGTKLFDSISQECYKLIDKKNHYQRYLDYLKLVNIPDTSTPAEPDSSIVPLTEVDLRHYNQLMDKVPCEKQSTQLLLHCLLEQVSVNVDGQDPAEKTTEDQQSPASFLENYIDQKLNKFGIRNAQQDLSTSTSTAHNVLKPPTILYYKDHIGERLFGMDNSDSDFDALTLERTMLKYHPICQLSAALDLIDEQKVKISSRNQQLARLWNDNSRLETPEPFWRGIQRLLFEALPIQTVDEYGDIDEPSLDDNLLLISLDDPFYDAHAHKEGARLDLTQVDTLRNLSNWSYLEPHQSDAMTQVLIDAIVTHPFIDTYFHKATGSLLIILHNPSGDNFQNKLSWDTWVHSNVGFRNYMDHITEYVDDWQREIDRFEEERLAEVTTPKVPEEDPSPVPLKPDNRNQMLTRQEIADIKAAEEDKGKKKGKKSARKSARADTGSKLRPGSKRSDTRGSSAKSSKSRVQSGKKKAGTGKGRQETADEDATENAAENAAEEREYQFQGYDIGDKLIHVSGTESYVFPGYGAIIKVDRCEYVQGSESIRTCLFKDGNSFIVHCRNPVEEPDTSTHDATASKQSQSSTCPPDIQVHSSESSKTKLEIGASNYQMGSFNPLNVELPSLPPLPARASDQSSLVMRYSDGFICTMSAAVSEELYRKYKSASQKLETVEVGQVDDKLGQSTLATAASTQHGKAGSPKGRKKQEDELKRQEELEKAKEQERRRLILELNQEIQELQDAIYQLQNLHMTSPDGLHVSFAVSGDNTNGKQSARRVVRQHYPGIKGNNHHCEKERATVALQEKMRCVTQDGQVIKGYCGLHLLTKGVEKRIHHRGFSALIVYGHCSQLMRDESVEIFCPSGAIIRARPCQPPSSTSTTIDKTSNEITEDGVALSGRVPSKRMSHTPITVKETSFELDGASVKRKLCFSWEIVDADGTKSGIDSEGHKEYNASLLSSVATCPKTKETFETREDGLSILRRVDGTVIVEHTDGTRLTVKPETDSVHDQETGESDCQADDTSNIIVKIECVGYATVVTNTHSGVLKVLFGEGSSVKSFKEGGYSVQRINDGKVHIDRLGTCMYTNDDKVEFDGKIVLTDDILPKESYLLRHTSNKCLSTIDLGGNTFTCTMKGDIHIQKGDPQNVQQDDSLSMDSSIPKATHPRFFLLYGDGSGEELLQNDRVEKYLKDVEQDSNSAILSSDISGYPGAKGITVIRPFQGSVGDQWLRRKEEKDIIPSELRERDFHTFPSRKERVQGPPPRIDHILKEEKFNRENGKQVIACPPVLELRHLIKQPSFTDDMKRMIFDSLSEYRDILRKRNNFEDGLQPTDPRTEEEITASRELLRKAYETFDKESEKEQAQNRQCVLFRDLIKGPFTQNIQKKAFIDNHESNVQSAYEEATAPPPSPPPAKAEPRRPLKDWEKDRIEVAEVKYAKDCLKFGIVPPYFDTEKGQAFLNSQRSGRHDLSALSAKLARQTIHPMERPISVESDATGQAAAEPGQTINDKRDIHTSLVFSNSSIPEDSFSDLPSALHDKVTVSRTRPGNPTPGGRNMSDSIDHFPSTIQTSTPIDQQSSIRNELSLQTEHTENDEADVSYAKSGLAKQDRVEIPRSIRGSRPGALRNEKFVEVEDPVRRTMKTASVAGSVNPDLTSKLRGFILIPDFVDFGVLREGCSYAHAVELKNVGVDMCRYKIKQPPPSTGLKVNYKPGPVAAGMSTTFELELFAIAVGVEGQTGIGSIAHHVEITTETDALYLPVVATILTAYEYENPSPRCPEGGPSQGTIQLKPRPLSRESLNRPRKFENV